jgi:hypothetical protein
MGRDTKFNEDWLLKKDSNNETVGEWCEKVTSDRLSARCRFCNKTFSIAKQGFCQILSHSTGKKHAEAMKNRCGQTVFKKVEVKQAAAKCQDGSEPAVAIQQSTVQLMVTKKESHWVPIGLDEKVRTAEALFALKLVGSNYSFASYDNLAETCKLAFPDSEIAQHMSLGSAKVAYSVVHGLAPYQKNKFLSDIRKASVPYFTIYFDETTTKQVKKQLDIYVGYWSDVYEQVVIVYIQSAFLGHATAQHLEQVILEFLSENSLHQCNLLHFSMDGPSVNHAFLRKITTEFQNSCKDALPLVELGTCSLHPVHTAVRKGVESIDFDIDQFVNDIFTWFKLSSARRSDYTEVQQEELLENIGQFFLKPVCSRWLSIEPVCRRIIEQFSCLKKYFLTELPKHEKSMISSSKTRYLRLKAALENPETLVYLNFIAFVSSSVTPFLLMFQSKQPLVHVLYEKANELVRQFMGMFIKPEVVGSKEGDILAAINCDLADNWLESSKMQIGSGTTSALRQVPKQQRQKELRLCFRKCLRTTTSYMQQHLPITNHVLRDLQCLHPVCRKAESARSAVSRLCHHLKRVTKTVEFADNVSSEWLLYAADKEIDTFSQVVTSDICRYWQCVSQIVEPTGNKKFTHLTTVAKAGLCLSHGNAPAERGFSVNTALLSKERMGLDEHTIQALRVVKEAIYLHGNSNEVPITRSLLHSLKSAHSEYHLFLENEKKKACLQEQREKETLQMSEDVNLSMKKKEELFQKLHDIEEEERVQLAEQDVARQLINEASVKLSTAVKDNKIQNAKVAQVMLDSGNVKLTESSKLLESIRIQKDKLQAKLLKAQKDVSEKQLKVSCLHQKVHLSRDEPPCKKQKH